ncbi:hypothetical protein FOS14_03825 [Skermania sp. ID1734]|uniref:hypothetical protein n=1 Tax=Skermania sp. ID1734 TaxID=2597516 RepID=UPI00117DCAFC|nr:hypothetical protein [Skermania sp. ID1734]TSE01662.1 hypothetical protein FOS14_03825 [Skermania sp. ID1734]
MGIARVGILALIAGAGLLSACSNGNDHAVAPSSSAVSTTTSTTATLLPPRPDGLPALFPSDFPLPPGLKVQESTGTGVTAVVSGTVQGSSEDFERFYDERLPKLGWKLHTDTSSGCAHIYSRHQLTVTIVCGANPASASSSTFQLTISSTE